MGEAKNRAADKSSAVEASQATVVSASTSRTISIPKLLLTVLALILLCGVALGGVALHRHIQKIDDQKTFARLNNFESHNTSCRQFLAEFGNTSAADPKVAAYLLDSQYNCSATEGNYNQTINYLNKLGKLYAVNPNITKLVNVASAKQELEYAKSEATTSSNSNNSTPTSGSSSTGNQSYGYQKDGTYDGP